MQNNSDPIPKDAKRHAGVGDRPKLHTEKSRWPSGKGRWFLAIVVLVLVGFPDVGLLPTRGGGVAAAQSVTDAEAALQLSYRHYESGRYEEAVTAAKAAIAANPTFADAYNNLAVSYLGLRMYDEALQAAQEAILIRPDYQLAKNNLTWIQQVKDGLALPPVSAAQIARGQALLNESLQQAQNGQFQECVATATEATNINPASAGAFNNLGFCAANLQLWDEAIRYIQEAIRLDPSFQLAKNNLVWTEERMKAATSSAR